MTTDYDQLLQSVLEAPEDDMPRLVMADWLEEHDQPEQAEFIRCQVEASQRLKVDKHDRKGLAMQERAIALHPKKALSLSSWLIRSDYHRGFLSSVWFSTERLIENRMAFYAMQDLFESHPLQQIVWQCSYDSFAVTMNIHRRKEMHYSWLLATTVSDVSPYGPFEMRRTMTYESRAIVQQYGLMDNLLIADRLITDEKNRRDALQGNSINVSWGMPPQELTPLEAIRSLGRGAPTDLQGQLASLRQRRLEILRDTGRGER